MKSRPLGAESAAGFYLAEGGSDRRGGVAEDVEIAFGGASGLGDMTASGGEIKGH